MGGVDGEEVAGVYWKSLEGVLAAAGEWQIPVGNAVLSWLKLQLLLRVSSHGMGVGLVPVKKKLNGLVIELVVVVHVGDQTKDDEKECKVCGGGTEVLLWTHVAVVEVSNSIG